MAAKPTTFEELLSTPLNQLHLGQSSVFVLGPQETLKKATATFDTHHISSAAVVDPTSGKVLGLLDFFDVVSFILSNFYGLIGKTDLSQEERLAALQEIKFSKSQASTLGLRFSAQPVKEVINYSKQNQYVVVPHTTPLRTVISHLANHLIQRVVVENEEGKIVMYLTQSTLLKHLAKHLELLHPLVDQQIAAHGFGNKKVIGINHKEHALVAFGKMVEFGISGLPILDDNGAFVGSITVKDIKPALGDFSLLAHTVREYISLVRMDSVVEMNPTIFCKTTDTLLEVIKKLVVLPLHRMFIVEDIKQFLPVGVVSYQDIISLISSKYSQ